MRSKTEVTNEIRKIVGDKVDAGLVVRIEWLTTEILTMKADFYGDDADFYVACGVDFIKQAVKDCVGAYKPKATAATDVQIVMSGFDYMQRAYTVERAGEILLVPVDQMTGEEIEARALELEAMARGCVAHAKELRAYGRVRGMAAA